MVKYADSPSASVRTDIAAPPEQVWPLVSDIGLPSRFETELVRAVWIDTPPATGATFRGFNRRESWEWDILCTVTGYDPDRCFEWTVGDVENKVARWRFDLEPSSVGTHLRFSAEMGPGPSGLTPAIEKMPDREEDIVARRLREWETNMQRTVEGIKAIAEGGEG